jgi:hypothetical protein
MELKKIYLGGSVPNILTDIILIVLSLPYAWRLNAPLAQRIVLAGMFMMGTFISIISIVRLSIFMRIPIATAADVTQIFREVIILGVVEINIGLVCACLPSLKPLVGMLGLNRLFTFNASRPSNDQSPGLRQSFKTFGGSADKRPWRKGSTGGLFSTLGGIKMDNESEEFRLTETQYAKTTVEADPRVIQDTDNESGVGKGKPSGAFHM